MGGLSRRQLSLRLGCAGLHDGGLGNAWLHPRYLANAYLRPALLDARRQVSGRLLNAGCGMRPHQDIFVDCVSAYIGMDKPLHKGRAGPQLIGDALHIPLSDGSVDAVLATEVMEHLSAPDSSIGEVSRVLRDGGSLVVSVPFTEPLHEEPRDYYRFTPHSLHDLMGKHGLQAKWIKPKGGRGSVTLGSFTGRALYDWANPGSAEGRRPNRPVALLLPIPLCAAAQLAAYLLDCIFKSSKYTLGFVLLAAREANGNRRDDLGDGSEGATGGS